jgi:hypothetical protein
VCLNNIRYTRASTITLSHLTRLTLNCFFFNYQHECRTVIIIIIVIVIFLFLFSYHMFHFTWYFFPWASGEPHHSGFKSQTVALSLWCVTFLARRYCREFIYKKHHTTFFISSLLHRIRLLYQFPASDVIPILGGIGAGSFWVPSVWLPFSAHCSWEDFCLLLFQIIIIIILYYIIDTFGIHIPLLQIREFSTFKVSCELWHSLSPRCAITANGTHILDNLAESFCPLTTFYLCESTWTNCFSLILLYSEV